ncbi:TetR/AcrR family transcriptional regulator [Paenibacillus sp. JZ16]|uniref:TetR/AcrR family transcriptional regulator n=1 Tax=Paenibacillus sp. JZ16 TaxID=1906272 RepID=UPI00188A1FD7|nr:TetR family transcriptional regulator [Paenibacillus sp. JZ16]
MVNEEQVQNQEKDVKQKILEAAKKLFAGKGFEGTSVREICDEAGVALALVSYHFGGKDKLLYALFEPLNEHFAKLSFNLAEPINALEAFIRGFVAYRYDNEELIHILQQEMMMQSPRLKMLSNAYYPSWVHLRAILEAGKSQGVFQFESIVYAVHFVMGVVIFSRQNPFLEPVFGDLPPAEDNAAQAAEHIIRLVLNGLHSS